MFLQGQPFMRNICGDILCNVTSHVYNYTRLDGTTLMKIPGNRNVGFHLIILGIHFSIKRSGGSPGACTSSIKTTSTKIKGQLKNGSK